MIPAWWLQGSAVWCLHCSSVFLKRCDRHEKDWKSVCPVPQTCLPSKTWSSAFCETECLGLGGEQGLGSNPDTEWQQLGNLFWVSVFLHQFDVNVSTLTLMCRDHCNEMLLMRVSEELWGWLMAKSIGCPCREPEPGAQHWQWEFYICLGLQLQRMCHLPLALWAHTGTKIQINIKKQKKSSLKMENLQSVNFLPVDFMIVRDQEFVPNKWLNFCYIQRPLIWYFL